MSQAPDALHLIGIDIGGTKSAAILGRPENDGVEILGRIAFPTDPQNQPPERTLERIGDAAETLLERHPPARERLGAVGISCGGPLRSDAGIVLSPPNLPGWDTVPVVDFFQRRLGVPARLQNDANAGALAEWRWGAGRGLRSMVFLTFGTGLGAGLLLEGNLICGPDDLAGEAGHLRLADDGPVGYGKAGSFEGFCSGAGIRHLAQRQVRSAWEAGETVGFCGDEEAWTRLDARRVAEAARRGDPVARQVFETSGFYLGRGLALLIDLLNPEAIVLGGIYGHCEDLLRDAARAVIAREALPAAAARCRLAPAQLGERIGDYAALAVALDAIRKGASDGT